MIKICVSGSKGKMGSRIAELAKEDKELTFVGSFDMGEESEKIVKECDCLVEFTTTEATIEHLALCEKLKKAIVIGTTGFSDEEKQKIKETSENIPVVFSPNMSAGVNVLFKIAGEAAKALKDDYNIEIVEAHHIHKKDAPSGTAKELARIINEFKQGNVPIESVREGEIVGEHTVTFDSDFDTLEITHSAKSRDVFAKGALAAAKFAAGKKHGLFAMKDVLGL